MRRTLAAFSAAAIILLGLGPAGADAYTNGYLPETALAPINDGVKCERPEGQLANPAAASWNTMALAIGKPLPINGCDSAYRPYERQVYWRTYWCGVGLCGNAAFPGTSNHGYGLAADVPTWVQGWLKLHGRRFCWAKTEAFQEPWHWNYTGCFHHPDPGTNLKYPRLQQHSGGPGQGIYVRKVQKLLRGHGFKTVTADGQFGWKTREAVKKFQKGQRIPVTGVVNRRTWKRLRRPVVKPVPAPPIPKPQPIHHHKHPKGPAWGIDISSNNGPVDFAAARKDGASFVVTKATEGTGYVNPYFGRNQIKAIKAAGLVPGVYDFLRPEASHSGRAEAAFFTNAVGHGGFGPGFLPPAADIEVTSLSPSGTCHYLGEWVHLVKANLGEKPMVYASPGFVESYLSGCSWLAHYKLWVAHYGVSHPTVPAPWKQWAIWQWTPEGHVAGVTADVDKVFHGRAALEELRVKHLPTEATLAPRAKLDLPLAGASSVELAKAAPTPPAAERIVEAPAPEGKLEPRATNRAAALAELIHALTVLIDG